VLGRSPADLIGLTRSALVCEGEGESLAVYRETITARRPFRDLTYVYRHPDGTPRWFEISGRPHLSPEGDFLGYHGVGSDVTEQHRTRCALVEAHAELSEQNRRFDAALENMTHGLCMYRGAALVAPARHQHLDDGALAHADMDRVVGQAEDPQVSVLRELADGRVIAVIHRPMADGGGWVATFEDITERRRNEISTRLR
jgi:PAS domain S-box-containing protein